MGAVDVLVVGSGPAGLAAAAEVKRRGRGVVVLERGESVAARWRSRYEGLRLNTYRAYSRLPGSRLPRAAGRYASLQAFVAYLDDYARRNDLDVRPGVEAERVDRNGPEGWRGRRVLVVGAGNSGVDVAGLLVRAGADVSVSMRTPPNVFPRDWLGLPLGPSVLIAEHSPPRSADWIGRFIQWQVYGNLSRYGVPRAPVGFMSRFRSAGVNPAVDDGFISALKSPPSSSGWPDVYPKRWRGRAEMLYLLVTAASWSGRSEFATSFPS